jgi:hypothetical protein
MGSRVWLPAIVAGLAFILAVPGCDSSDEESTEAVDDHPAALVGAPDEGTCWSVPADSAADPDYWFDDSREVPCTEPHTTETVSVLRLTEPSIAEAKEAGSTCWDRVRIYIGVDLDHWVPWGDVAFLPSREQVADGASWVRCDVVFPASWDAGSVRTTTGPAAGVAEDPPADLWACLDEHPNKAKQPFVPCDQPHQYEQTGTLAFLDNLDHYPSAAELDSTAQRQCAYGIQGEESNVAFTARWDPRSALHDSTEIAGACFMFSKTGEPLPPRQ